MAALAANRLILGVSLFIEAAWAAEKSAEPKTTQHTETRTTVTQEEVREGGTLKSEIIGLKPQAGIITFRDDLNDRNTRFVVGMTIDANLLGSLKLKSGKPYLGPSTGAIFSHIGASQSNFFGFDAPRGLDSGSNILLLPLNLKAGWTFGENFRIAAHGGANIIYTNATQSVRIGPTGASATQEDWSSRANIGGDLEVGLGRHVGLMFRPDWTFVSDNPIFTATAAVVFPLS